MQLNDAIFNWLQMKIVYEARLQDQAAKDTLDFFAEILHDDHHIDQIEVHLENESHYVVTYLQKEQTKPVKHQIDREAVEKLLEDINSNPKYN